ncbi:hypothetical protein RUND412_004068 [Rhizina undulata]
MLSSIPAELLLNILSYVDNLQPVSATSHLLSQAARDVRVHELRTRLARTRHIEVLMNIWTPPMFFNRRHPNYTSQRQDLYNILCDPQMLSYVDQYIRTLERNLDVAEAVASHVLSLVSFNYPTHGERLFFATRLVLELWSASPRYAHDVDGRWDHVTDDARTEDVIRDPYVQRLPQHIQTGILTVYDALAEHLRPPFSSRRNGGIWLYRHILKASLSEFLERLISCLRVSKIQEGMEGVLNMFNQRSHR